MVITLSNKLTDVSIFAITVQPQSVFCFPGNFQPIFVLYVSCVAFWTVCACQLHHLPIIQYVCLLTHLASINTLVHAVHCDREVPLSAFLSDHRMSPGDYKAGLCHSADWRAGVHVSNIDTHGPGTHAVGTIPMTLQLGMFPCSTQQGKQLRIIGERWWWGDGQRWVGGHLFARLQGIS